MKRTVFVCDQPDCGAVLIHPEDGFIIYGRISDSNTADGEQKHLVNTTNVDPPTEIAFCRECMAKALGLQVP